MIKTDRLNIRLLEERDIEMIRQWRNIYREHFFDSSEISKEQQRAWYTNYQSTKGTDQMYILELKDGTPIGQCALYNIDITSRKAVFGRFLLLEEFRHVGYAEEAVKGVLNYAFKILRLYKIKVEVFLENIDAIAIYARSGFKTTTKPIILMEAVNYEADPNKPLILEE
jgi:RimJ/RimL family protein N-acetyltransferase